MENGQLNTCDKIRCVYINVQWNRKKTAFQ